ncbi:hypothetical protein [Pantoea ananatis]|uniref:hypothetical protein n=1 Tax=Pantoea ananas TaxID=553 RepID=UPI000FEC2392|nr:hypothetical protein [Pantoea ananatis]QAB30887.1 hypothetical protein EPK90_14350 [Pantoea ananatis]
MPKLETIIRLPPDIAKAVLPIIKEQIPADEFKLSRKIRTIDSASGGGGAVSELIIEVLKASPVCLAIAAIVRQYIVTRSSKKIKIQTKDFSVDVENLTTKELMEICEKYDQIVFKENKKSSGN